MSYIPALADAMIRYSQWQQRSIDLKESAQYKRRIRRKGHYGEQNTDNGEAALV